MELDPSRLIGLSELFKLVIAALPKTAVEVTIAIDCMANSSPELPPDVLARLGSGNWEFRAGWSSKLVITIDGGREFTASKDMNIHAGAIAITAAKQTTDASVPPFRQVVYRLKNEPDGWRIACTITPSRIAPATPSSDRALLQSIGEILRGDPAQTGIRHVSAGGASYTVKATQDPTVPGGRFISVTDQDGKKRTIVYDRNGRAVKDSGWT